MAKTNINFNNKTYSIDESSLAPATAELQSHLSTVMNGTGATINLGGITYNVDSAKLSDATSTFVSHLGEIAGSGSKVIVGGVEHFVDTSKIQGALSKIANYFDSLNVVASLQPGLYEKGAYALYQSGQQEEAEALMKTSWEELVANEIVHVTDGVVYSNYDSENWENSSADVLVGELVLPNDGSITTISDGYYDSNWNYFGTFGFYYCNALESIIIPASVTSIGCCAFSECTALTSVIFEEGSQLTLIGNEAFSFDEKLSDITIPVNVHTIGENAFASCANLLNIEIPASVTTIGDYGFTSCTSLTSVIFAENSQLTSIGKEVFKSDKALKSVVFEGDCRLETIGQSAFSSCGLPSIGPVGSGAAFEIPASVTTIGENAFNTCKLTSVEIPAHISIIGARAFGSISQLVSLIFEEGSQLTSIGEYAFTQCNALNSITFEGTIAQWNAIKKLNRWNNKVPATYVQCSDGQVEL